MRSFPRSLAGAVALLAASTPAFAHEGHDHGGLVSGLLHPVGGFDHLLATVGVGLIAGLVARGTAGAAGAAGAPAARGALGAAIGLLAGALAAVAFGTGAGFGAEAAVALGLLVLALCIARAERIGPRALALAAVAIALPHVWLHAVEGSGAGFFAGLGLASAMLFAVGARAGRALASRPPRTAAPARWLIAAGYVGAFAWLATQGVR